MRLEFAGKTVAIVGACGGIGSAVAEEFLRSDSEHVILLDNNEIELNKLSAQLEVNYPGRVTGVTVDLRKSDSIGHAVHQISDRFERIDVLVNSAGVNKRRPALDITESDWDMVLDINLRGLFFFTQGIAPKMIEHGAGSIVNIASVSSLRGHSNLAPYAASKGGIAQLTKVLANEWAPSGVRVNSVAPGYVRTKLTQEYLADPTVKESIVKKIPTGRVGEPDEIAAAVIFLASDVASYITGSMIVVDGGRTID
jgi:2-deoxy-D-gluconate 3-dehydrogenase